MVPGPAPDPLPSFRALRFVCAGLSPGWGQGSVCVRGCVIIPQPAAGTPSAPELAVPPPGLHGKVLPGVLPQFFALPLQSNYSLFCSLRIRAIIS